MYALLGFSALEAGRVPAQVLQLMSGTDPRDNSESLTRKDPQDHWGMRRKQKEFLNGG